MLFGCFCWNQKYKNDIHRLAVNGIKVHRLQSQFAAVGVAILATLASGGLGIKNGLSATEIFIEKPEAVLGQEVLADAFPAGSAAPTYVIVSKEYADEAAQLVDIPGVASIAEGDGDSQYAELRLVVDAEPESAEALQIIRDLRTELEALPSDAVALVGGQDATSLDLADATARDQALLVPLILISVFLILILLLRSLAAPIFLMIAVVGSFFSAVGASWLPSRCTCRWGRY